MKAIANRISQIANRTSHIAYRWLHITYRSELSGRADKTISDKRLAISESGFTLIELLIVLAIVAILGAMIIPPWFRQMDEWKLDAAAKQIQSHIRLAQERAIAEQKIFGVGFSTGANLYSVYGEDGVIKDPIKRDQNLIVDFDDDDQLKGITLTNPNFGGNSYVNFGSLGNPTNGGNVTIEKGTKNRKIGVEAETGSVSIW